MQIDCVDRFILEEIAILLGVKWYSELHVRHVEIESDSLD